ncbi:DUF6221 family protein [Micromonospora carbonacea]|uniref:Uncharacterized protein n=1 Tax=Micromonospora carbonacea TaxID=47853 RepID=A0A1C5A265_9ACTN|nr:DUF6221 family protein [Micromonospora carbonacea]SCF39312.1 hypothetical protein GA0070563_1115 [Micromonospora carbonacea]
MDDLVTWLRAQIDDRERVVRAAKEIRKPYYFEFIDEAAQPFVDLMLDPDRELAELDAKRRVLDLYEELNEPHLYEAIRLLALPHADRPGYREEWRP